MEDDSYNKRSPDAQVRENIKHRSLPSHLNPTTFSATSDVVRKLTNNLARLAEESFTAKQQSQYRSLLSLELSSRRPTMPEVAPQTSPPISALASELASLKAKQTLAQTKLRDAKSTGQTSETEVAELRRVKLEKEGSHKELIDQWKNAYKRKEESRIAIDSLTEIIEEQQNAKFDHDDAERKAAEEVDTIVKNIAEAERKLAVEQEEENLRKQWRDPVDREFTRSLGWGDRARDVGMAHIVEILENENLGLGPDHISSIGHHLSRIDSKLKPTRQPLTLPMPRGKTDWDDTQPVSTAAIRAELDTMNTAKRNVENMTRVMAGVKRKRSTTAAEASTTPSSSEVSGTTTDLPKLKLKFGYR